ncbi:hypothetical protein [Pasteurella testudinis]|uniref:hypothetical protein n=1 Tax=Pasteurella testudinis TaxID=761 RepID=UPI0040597A4D
MLFIPTEQLYQSDGDEQSELPPPKLPLRLDAQQIYERQIKPLYSELLDFTSKMEVADSQQQQLAAAHMAVSQMMAIVKDSKHLQKNMQLYLQQPQSALYRDYLRLRKHLFKTLCLFRRIANESAGGNQWQQEMDNLNKHLAGLETFRGRVMVKLRNGEIDGWQTSSLMNDSNYARRIGYGVIEILNIASLELPQGIGALSASESV